MDNFLTMDSPISDTKVIQDYIEDDLASEHKREMQDGWNYFHAKHDIRKRRITYKKDGQEVIDETRANHKLTHPFFRLLVLQKAGYIVGNPIVFSVDGDDKASEDFENRLNELLGERFDDKASMWVQGSAAKGVEWLHPYIDKDGQFKYTVIPAEQIIPIYDTEYEENLEAIIRYYSITVVNGDEKKIRYKVELWDKDKVTYFMEQDSGSYIMDDTMDPNPRAHWYSFNTNSPETIVDNSWGKIPFIALENNDEQIPDIRFTKSMIDDYDLNGSDFSNNLSDIQQLIWVLKNYDGTSLEEFMHNLKTFKAIKVEGEGGVTTESVDIPKEARDSHMDRLEDNIFVFGMGVNMKTDKFGNSPSGVALQFMYSLLDMNANIMIRKMKNALRDFTWFVTEYINLVDWTQYDAQLVRFTFNKSMITNTAEIIDSTTKSKGIISDKTILENHPWVDDVAEEERRLEAEADRIILPDDDEVTDEDVDDEDTE